MNLFIPIAIYEAIQQARELAERHEAFREAEEYASRRGKPMLVVGKPRVPWSHPTRSTRVRTVVIDISPAVVRLLDGVIADIRLIPYPDGFFSSALVSHVLEHLRTREDALKALQEVKRVAERIWIVSPHKTSLLAWLNGDHHLWVELEDGEVIIEERRI